MTEAMLQKGVKPEMSEPVTYTEPYYGTPDQLATLLYHLRLNVLDAPDWVWTPKVRAHAKEAARAISERLRDLGDGE